MLSFEEEAIIRAAVLELPLQFNRHITEALQKMAGNGYAATDKEVESYVSTK